MPAVCRHYLKGYCRFGANCRYEHPGEEDYQSNSSSGPSAQGFSFKAAISKIAPSLVQQTPSSNPTQSSGFSFIKALQNTSPNSPLISHDDVDMSDNLDSQLAQRPSIFSQTYQNLRTEQPRVFSSTTSTSIFAPIGGHQQTLIDSRSNQQFNSFQPIAQSYHQEQQQQQFQSQPQLQQQLQHQPQQQAREPETPKDTTFSNTQDLSPEEIEAFERAEYQFRRIPVRPPAKVHC